MLKKVIFLGLTSAFVTISIPDATSQTPIRSLQQQSQGVSINGVVRNIVGNEFILDDGTGQVIVDAGPRWWHQINLNPGEQVTVVGESDGDDFDAFTITRNDGTVLNIRSPQGPPPWAGKGGRR